MHRTAIQTPLSLSDGRSWPSHTIQTEARPCPTMPARATDHPTLLPTRPDNYPTAKVLRHQFAIWQPSERPFCIL